MSDMLPKLFFEHFRPTRFVAECNDNISYRTTALSTSYPI